MPTITSRQNPIVSRFRAVARGEAEGLLLDGVHLVADALAAGIGLREAAVVEGSDRDEVAGLTGALEQRGIPLTVVTTAVMDALSPVRTSSPIVALADAPHEDPDAVYRAPALTLICAGIQDPGNLGAMVRVAEAGGATGIICTDGSADPWGWKALRGSMGSALRLPMLVRTSDEAIADARRRGCRIVAAVPRDGRPFADIDFRGPTALLIGGEGAGLPPALVDAADERATIPMAAAVESLNAAVAAALLVYEAHRQRAGVPA